jgi:hypothetical protein
MFNFLKRIYAKNVMFNGHFVDVRSFYAAKFNKVPCVIFIGELDISKVYAFIKETYGRDVYATYQHSFFNHDDKKIYFNNTILVLSNERMIEIANDYCHVLHTPGQYHWAKTLANDLAQFRVVKEIAGAFKHTHVVGFAKETAMN